MTPTLSPDRAAVPFGWIEAWYNPRRRHSGIGYLAPVENNHHHAQAAASVA